jgi:hypothetical protein
MYFAQFTVIKLPFRELLQRHHHQFAHCLGSLTLTIKERQSEWKEERTAPSSFLSLSNFICQDEIQTCVVLGIVIIKVKIMLQLREREQLWNAVCQEI